MRNYRARGIVIRRDNMGETDRRITIFTDRFGKVSIIAKGARRPKSRLASSTDLFCEIEFIAARGRSLGILTESKIISSHCDIGSAWAKTKNAYWVGELINNLVHDEEPNPGLYKLLSDTLKVIDGDDSVLVVDYFIFNCLRLLGYEPELKKCAVSGKQLSTSDKLLFDPAAGGVVCGPNNHGRGRAIDVGTIKALRYLKESWPSVVKLKITPQIQKDIHMHLKDFAEATLEREIKSDKLK